MLSLLLKLLLSVRLIAVPITGRCNLSGLIKTVMRASFTSNFGDLLRRRGNPLAALPGLDTKDVHGINLLERATLSFNDKEVDQEDGDQVAAREDVAVEEV